MGTEFLVGDIPAYYNREVSIEEQFQIINRSLCYYKELANRHAADNLRLEDEIEEFEARIARFAQLIHAAENEVRALKTQLQQANQTINQLRSNRDDKATPNGCVYIIKASTGEYKIGKTKNVAARFSQLQVGSPVKLKFILSIVTDDMDNLEQHLHRQFSNRRGIGEWFAIGQEDIEAIRKEYADYIVELD